MVTGANLATLKTMLSSFEPQSVSAKELKPILSLYMNMDPQSTKAEVINNLQESLPVETLFHTNIIRGPKV